MDIWVQLHINSCESLHYFCNFVTPLHKEDQEIALCHPKRHVSIWECFPVVQVVPLYLSNSVCDSSARICRSCRSFSFPVCAHCIGYSSQLWTKIVAFWCFSVTNKIKRHQTAFWNKLRINIYIYNYKLICFIYSLSTILVWSRRALLAAKQCFLLSLEIFKGTIVSSSFGIRWSLDCT